MVDNIRAYDDVRVLRRVALSDTPQYLRLLRDSVYAGNDIGSDQLEIRLAEIEQAIDNLSREQSIIRAELASLPAGGCTYEDI